MLALIWASQRRACHSLLVGLMGLVGSFGSRAPTTCRSTRKMAAANCWRSAGAWATAGGVGGVELVGVGAGVPQAATKGVRLLARFGEAGRFGGFLGVAGHNHRRYRRRGVAPVLP